jgi:hypothetical protein
VDHKSLNQGPQDSAECPVNVENGPDRRPYESMEYLTGLPHPAAPQTSGYQPGDGMTSVAYDTPQSFDSSAPDQFFGRGLLSIEKAQSLLGIFRGMCQYFPFVIIPADATVQSLFYDKPFLLLSVLTASSSKEKRLQHVLEEELRSTLSTKVVFAGEKSLDLLQGLLVYLAWFV